MPHLFAFDIPPRIDEPELIDDDAQPYEDFRASLHDVRQANRFLGGTRVVTRQVARWLQAACRPDEAHPDRPVTFLDVATGSGDIPEAILRVSRRVGVPARVVGLDYSTPILRVAKERVEGQPEIRLMRGDAFRLPLADRSVDYAICSLAFHHFTREQSVTALREMDRVARLGWLVNDVRRAWSAWMLIRIVTALIGANRMTRHDAPTSVLRAYTPEEFRALACSPGLSGPQAARLHRSLFYRMALVRDKAP